MQPNQSNQPVAGNPSPQPGQQSPPPQPSQQKPSFYRQYWPFGIIFIFVPLGLIFGIIVLLTGGVFKNKDGKYTQISTREKVTLVVAAVLLQGFFILGRLG